MRYLVPVFMGSESDMDIGKAVFDELDSFGIPWSKEIISGEKYATGLIFGEKYPCGCLDRVIEFDKMEKKTPYLVIVGKGNTMGPEINGATHNPAVTNPKGSKAELEMDMWSSLSRPKDAPLITVFGDGRASGLYMAEIVGLEDEETRAKVCDKKGIKYGGETRPLASVIYDGNFDDKLLRGMLSKFTEFGVFPEHYEISEAKRLIKGGMYPTGPAILISRLSDSKVRMLAETAHCPLIVTPSYGKNELTTLREDAEGFLGMSLETTLPVGVALLPENAALAALRIAGLGNERYLLSERMKDYQKKVRDQYKKP